MEKNKNRLRVVRADRDVSQVELAFKTGINQSKISLIENGYVEPSKEEREDIAAALSAFGSGTPVTPEEIFPAFSSEAAAS